MRNFFRRFNSRREMVSQNRWLKPFSVWLHHPDLWHLHRRSVAGGVAVGLFCGLVPGPFQVISAALMAVLLRVNLPVAAITTFYTNPLTIVPLYLLAYEIGSAVLGIRNGGVAEPPPFPELHWDDWMGRLWSWLEALGEPLLVGLPLLAAGLAFIGYFAVLLTWRLVVMWKWRQRARR